MAGQLISWLINWQLPFGYTTPGGRDNWHRSPVLNTGRAGYPEITAPSSSLLTASQLINVESLALSAPAASRVWNATALQRCSTKGHAFAAKCQQSSLKMVTKQDFNQTKVGTYPMCASEKSNYVIDTSVAGKKTTIHAPYFSISSWLLYIGHHWAIMLEYPSWAHKWRGKDKQATSDGRYGPCLAHPVHPKLPPPFPKFLHR